MPTGIVPGQVYLHSRFYKDERGRPLPKYLVVLAIAPGGDIVFRLLTSQPHGRPENPRCYHGDPYPGFYLGVLGDPLILPTWIDLRKSDDYEETEFREDLNSGIISKVLVIPQDLFCDALTCAANAEDTTRQQELATRRQRDASGCAQ